MSEVQPYVSAQGSCVLRDGVALASTVYLPAAHDGAPLPTVLLRTPYNPELFHAGVQGIADEGFSVVVQSVRGRYGSGGEWRPYANEGPDGYDAIEWCAEQSWSDGNVATIGASYSGWTQWAAAALRPPSLRTMISSVACMSWTGEWPWRNGVLWPGAIAWLNMTRGDVDHSFTDEQLTDLLRSPMTPLSALQQRFGHELPIADEWLAHPAPGEYWSPITLTDTDFAGIDLPVLHITGWFDGCQVGSQLAYEGMLRSSPAAAHQALLIGAWDHQVAMPKREYDGLDFGEANVADYSRMRLEWLRGWLVDAPAGRTPQPLGAEVFDTGTLSWARLPAFPAPAPRTQHVELYFAADQALSWSLPSDLGEDTYRYDPADPTPCRTGTRPGAQPSLIRDALQDRDDIVVYRSEPLAEGLVLSGAIEAELCISSDAPDTDFVVTVGDRDESCRTVLVAHGMMRARFHAGMTSPQLLQPGEIYSLAFSLTARRHTFLPGHSLVVEIASSASPLWAANPNSGGEIFSEDDPRVATNTLHHGAGHRSLLRLPIEEHA